MPEHSLKTDPRHAIWASYLAIIGQAVVNNFVPLLLITFEREYGLTLKDIAILVGFNFFVQLVTDFVAIFVADRIGYKRAMVFGQACSFLGMAGLAFFPALLKHPFLGLMLSVTIYAIGGGLSEVLVSPIVEHSPSPNKAAAMSLLHSFYCWGHVFVVLFSSLYFLIFGIEAWRALAVIWALLPLINSYYFSRISVPQAEGQGGMAGALLLFKKPIFWLMLVMMICSGASEQSVVQWASAFAESGLKISKATGDLLGPMIFAAVMGLSRALHARYGDRLDLRKLMVFSTALCVIAYLLIIFSPGPAPALIGVGLTGFSVGLFWPGTLSLAALRIPLGGTAMYALLALGGDVGCSLGPSVVGFVSDKAGGALTSGFLAALFFPVILLLLLLSLREKKGSLSS